VRKAVFLDRDGVLNAAVVRHGKPYPPDSPAELAILPGVAQSLLQLRAGGFLNIVVTNQPDVATGKQTLAAVEAMHGRLSSELAIDAVKVCYHVDRDACGCRKPKPGMLLEAAQELDVDLARSFLVGDRWRDITAGQVVGCTCFFVDYRYDERRPEPPFIAVESLPEAASLILSWPDRGPTCPT
jgi:D-glycero-D-manno-heptose 1,7-bisphosphate phosphatase